MTELKILKQKRCIIGEGPIYNEKNNSLYYTNGGAKQMCIYNMKSGEFKTVDLKSDCAAFAFDKSGRLIVSRHDGVFFLNPDGISEALYDLKKNEIKYANDMKSGPDGRIYVGTQSERRMGISDKLNGKLYSIDKFKNVKLLLDGMSLSNGMAWSPDGKMFYHTDSDTSIIKEYYFDGEKGEISFSGRQIKVSGADGFTADKNGRLYVACWGRGHVAVVNAEKMSVEEYISLPISVPSSCSFVGDNMDILAVTSASFDADADDENAGFTILIKMNTGGIKPYLFG